MPDTKPHVSLVPVEQTLREALVRVRMIAATTPIELNRELERLHQKWQMGDPCLPQFVYAAPQNHHELITTLEALAEHLDSQGSLRAIYADRALEIATEAKICMAVGTSQLRPLARQRFSRRDHFDALADQLAEDWLAERLPDSTITENVLSDDPGDSRSLLSRLREEMGKQKIPFRVVVARDSSALAATGESFVQIAGHRFMSVVDVERTVLHEIEGHVLPRCRASVLPLGIFALGTRNGVDDQEGRALGIERRAGFLTAMRRRELAYRHKASRMLETDADFVETARVLLQFGASLTDALRITARAFRGGGLGREVVYLPAFLRVDAAIVKDPEIDVVLGSGRVSVGAAEVLKVFIREMH